jgi:hypothetical protein
MGTPFFGEEASAKWNNHGVGERDIVEIRRWLAQNAATLKRLADELSRMRKQLVAWSRTAQSQSKQDGRRSRS